jgi:hypothetical protein
MVSALERCAPLTDTEIEPASAAVRGIQMGPASKDGNGMIHRRYGCDQTGCGGLSVVEQPASLIGALNSPHDKSADERQSLETKPISRGTESPKLTQTSAGNGIRLCNWAPPSPSMLKHLRDVVLLFSMIAERMP